MLNLINTSKILKKYLKYFINRNIIISGNIQDEFASIIKSKNILVLINKYNYWKKLQKLMIKKNIIFDSILPTTIVQNYNTLIYFWQKNKQESLFQINNICSKLDIGSQVFIVGENRSGVKCAKYILNDILELKKINSAYHATLYYGITKRVINFNINNWWHNYKINNIKINTLPGVFSYKKLDDGSNLLCSTFTNTINGNILDLGCGSGVLATVIGSKNQTAKLFLSDINATAIKSAISTLKTNNLNGEVIASDVYSNINKKFDWIISNPPFHENIKTNYFITKNIISKASNFLNKNGRLCIVANAFLPYHKLLNKFFGKYQIIKKTNKFKVYKAIKQ